MTLIYIYIENGSIINLVYSKAKVNSSAGDDGRCTCSALIIMNFKAGIIASLKIVDNDFQKLS